MFSVKHLFCGNVKAITCIVDEVLVEEIVQAVSAFDDFEDRNEEDEEDEEDYDSDGSAGRYRGLQLTRD